MPESADLVPFRVEVESDSPKDLELEVGISLPDAFEAISWPGWVAATEGDLVFLRGKAKTGTLLIFISGTRTIDYSIQVVPE